MNGNTSGAARGAAFLTLLAGLFLIVAPWWVGFSANNDATVNSWVLGIIVALTALPALGMARGLVSGWATVVAGIWLVISPFVIGFASGSNAGMSTWILGIIAIVLGAVTAMGGTMGMSQDSMHGDTRRRMHG